MKKCKDVIAPTTSNRYCYYNDDKGRLRYKSINFDDLSDLKEEKDKYMKKINARKWRKKNESSITKL